MSGPRQSGKTALLFHLFKKEAKFIECDDLNVRKRLNEDPALFLGDLKTPVIIDEAHYAPNVFSELKLRVDRAKREKIKLPAIWITGSNQTLMSENVRETLAGRSQYYDLNTLSIHELGPRFDVKSFLLRGGWPELNKDLTIHPSEYLDQYIRTFVEKDIALSSGVTKVEEFLNALRLLSTRSGHIINANELGGEIGIKGETLQNWIQILERNQLVTLVKPFSNNLNKRLIKSPKFFFNEVSLATRLQGWRNVDPLIISPLVGSLFETIAFSEIMRVKNHLKCEFDLFHYRNKEKEEIDFVLQTHHEKKGLIQLAIEVKYASQSVPKITWPKKIESDLPHLTEKWVVTLNQDQYFSRDKVLYLPINRLTEEIIRWTNESII